MEDIESVVDQINKYDAYQGRIAVLGGEPTLNSICIDICRYLKSHLLRAKGFLLATNSSDSVTAAEVAKLGYAVLRDDVDMEKSRALKARKHWNIALSPRELGLPTIKCDTVKTCGIAVHKYAGSLKWSWCGPGTTIAKLMCREDFLKSSLKELFASDLTMFTSKICPNCIHSTRYGPLAKDTPGKVSECFRQGLEKMIQYNAEVNGKEV